jgi:PAS domain S-box-containing protein
MASNIFQGLFQGQMDLTFFFKGLAFFLVLAVSYLFHRDTSHRLPWGWFRLFALAQAIAAWLSLAAMNLGNPLYLSIGGDFLQILSWIFLAEFGRFGISRILNRDSGLWLIGLLFMLTALGGLKGFRGIELTSRYALGLGGGLWAAAVLFMAGRHVPSWARGGSLVASLSLALYAFSVGFFLPSALAPPGSLFTQEAFLKFTGVPLAFCQALLAFGMAAGLYGFLSWRHKAQDSAEMRYRFRYLLALLTTLALILGLGSVLTLYLGSWPQKRDERVGIEAQEFATVMVGRFNSEFKRMEDGVIALAETSWLPKALQNPDRGNLAKINALLDQCRENLKASVCYIMGENGVTVASSNRNAPESFVGKTYAYRPYFQEAISGKVGRYFAVGVTPGYYVSYPIRDPSLKNFKAVAVVKVTLSDIAKELEATGAKDNSIICLVDPRGVVFLSSQADMIFESLWPVPEKDLAALKVQYDKAHYAAIFPKKIGDGSKVDYKGRHYLASFAGTINPGWSVVVFRTLAPVRANRLTAIAVAGLLALLGLSVLGTIFYFKDFTQAVSGRPRARYDAAPEAIGVIDPETLQIVEANSSLAAYLGYTQTELLNLKLDRLISQKPQEIHEQFGQIHQEGEAGQIVWRARKKDGTLIDLEVTCSWVEHQGRDQILIFCRETETLPQQLAVFFREKGPMAPPPAAEDPTSLASGTFKEDNKVRNGRGTPPLPKPEGEGPPNNADQLDQEAEELIKKIEKAMGKV